MNMYSTEQFFLSIHCRDAALRIGRFPSNETVTATDYIFTNSFQLPSNKIKDVQKSRTLEERIICIKLVNCPSRMTGKSTAVNTHCHKYYPIKQKIP
jgi:hypothetical protein